MTTGQARRGAGAGVATLHPMPDALSPAYLTEFRRWDEHGRVVLAGDDALAVWRLHKAGYLDKMKRRTPLYRLSERGRAAMAEAGPQV